MCKKLFIIFVILLSFCSTAFAKDKKVYPKPEVITFYQKKCVDCEQLKADTQSIKDEFSNQIDFIYIDYNDDDCDFTRLKSRYNVTKVPTTIFINAQYQITKKVSGYIPQKRYLKHIKQILK